MPNVLRSLVKKDQKQEATVPTAAEKLAAMEAMYNANYPTSKPQWSFTLSITLDRPIDEVVSKLAGLDNLETVSRLNPVCVEYKQIARDWVTINGHLADSRVREMPAWTTQENTHVEEGKGYERVQFESRESMRAFWGLLNGFTSQRGTYVYDEEERIGLWEVTTTDKAGLGAWLRKVIKYVDAGNGKTRIDEFFEGYSEEGLSIFEGFAKRYTMDLHRNWMNKYYEAL